MARQSVVEVTCGRCGGTETQKQEDVFDPPKDQKTLLAVDGSPIEFTMRFRGKEIGYPDLCKSCRKSLENVFERVTKVTPENRVAKTEAANKGTGEKKKKEEKPNPPPVDIPGFGQKQKGPRAASG